MAEDTKKGLKEEIKKISPQVLLMLIQLLITL